jgi:hypothetical protein
MKNNRESFRGANVFLAAEFGLVGLGCGASGRVKAQGAIVVEADFLWVETMSSGKTACGPVWSSSIHSPRAGYGGSIGSKVSMSNGGLAGSGMLNWRYVQ